MAFLGGLTSLVSSSPSVLAVSAGVLAGAVTGTAVVASGVLSSPAPEQLTLVACPATDTVVARVTAGQSMLVTAQSGDGTWLQLYIGEPGIDSGWAPASALRISDSLDSLPVRGCEVAAAPETLAPGATPTPTPEITPIVTLPPGVTPSPVVPTPFATPTPFPTPTPKPTPTPTPLPPGVTPTPFVATPLPPPPTIPPPTPTPTPTPTPPPAPTPTPDTTKPSLSSLTTSGGYAGGNGDYYIYGPSALSFCPYPTATMKVNASDASGVSSITLYYWPGNSGVLSTPMSRTSGTATSGQWTGSFSAADSWTDAAFNEDPNGLISYWVVATDAAGNQQTLNHSNSYRLYSGQCGF